jgi:hypothetical protein
MLVPTTLLLVLPLLVPAQPASLRIPYQATCSQCAIEITRILSFGTESDPSLVMGTVPTVDGRGRYFARAAGELKVIVFDSLGRYQVAFGQAGQGPGEFSGRISRILSGPGDSLFVFNGAGRIEVFSPDLRFVRSVRVPIPDSGWPNTAAVLPSGFLIKAVLRTPNQIGLAFHVLDHGGRIVRSFGGGSQPIVPGPSRAPDEHQPFLLATDRESLWTTADTGFILEHWRIDGMRLASIEVVNVPWMRPVAYYDTVIGRGSAARTVRRARPHPSVKLVAIDKSGRLWLNSAVPGDGQPPRYAVHVFDPRSRRLIVSRPSEKPLTLLSGELAVTVDSDANGIMTYSLWRVTLRGA